MEWHPGHTIFIRHPDGAETQIGGLSLDSLAVQVNRAMAEWEKQKAVRVDFKQRISALENSPPKE